MDSIQKIAECNIQRYGARGKAISIPKIFTEDNGLERGDTLEIYRARVEGKDALVLMVKKSRARLTENAA
jgi:bifunctional DNA-binding transcriptional regulator/antitoxin component of YhaV-PrlF toxin-antitoxin module